MVTTVSPDSTATSPAPGPLQLRVRGTRHDGRLVELNAQKCAVGGGRQATLRIAGPALEPVEVLILRGAQGTVAKAWSTSARLNGRRFEAASLSPGDLLAIGPLELEVVACPPPVGLAESPAGGPRFTELLAPPLPPSAYSALAGRPRSGTDRQRSRRLLGALRAARQELESALTAASAAGSQADHLNHLLQAGQAEVDRLRAEVHCEGQRKSTELSTQEEALAAARAELAAQRIELNGLRAELDRRAEDLLHRESGAAGALADRKTELAAREESLGLARAEMDRQHMEADEHRRQMDAERRLLAQRQTELDERSEALDRHDDQARLRTQEIERRAEEVERAAAEHRELAERRQQAGDEQAAFEAQRLAWESQRGDQQARIAEEQQRLIDEAERLDHARRALESERIDWERERTEAAEAVARIEVGPPEPAATKPAPRQSAEDSPADEQDNEVFARLRALSLLRDSQPAAGLGSDEELEEETAEAPTRREPLASAAWSREEAEEAAEEDSDDFPPSVLAPAGHADDEGEESIQDYMNRLLQRVRGDAPPSQNKPASQAPLRSPTTYRPAPAPQVVATPAAPMAPPRKSHAPERSSDLLAMRELANLSAQTALDSYAHRRWASAAVGKVIVSVFALMACLTLMAALPGWSTLKIVSGGAALVIAVFWGLQAGILAQQVRAARQRRTPRPASEAPPAKGHSQLVTSEADEPFIPTARPADGENDQLAD